MNITLIIIWILTGVVHMINTLAYSVRLSGVKTRRLALALSLFNIIFIASQLANSIQAPLFANFIERSISSAQATGTLEQLAGDISWEIRGVLLAATAGTVLGAILIPFFYRFFVKVIYVFEQVGSVPRLILLVFSPAKLREILAGRVEQYEEPKEPAYRGIPKTFLVLNIIVTGIYTTGVLSSVFAGVLIPEFRSTATTLANVVNGFATVLLVILVDPIVARIIDQANRGDRTEAEVKKMVNYLAVTRIGGTVLAQVLLWPAAYFIVWITKLISTLG